MDAGSGGVEDERARALAYWRDDGIREFYFTPTHWSAAVAQLIGERAPASVLEFGCNGGRNLVAVRGRLPNARLMGIDINAEAVEEGVRRFGLDLRVGDEHALSELADRSVDAVFVVSVLDHVPTPAALLEELWRVCGDHLVMLEPYLGVEGRQDVEDVGVTDVGFSYSWDVAGLARDLDGADVTISPLPLTEVNLGPYYWLVSVVRRA